VTASVEFWPAPVDPTRAHRPPVDGPVQARAVATGTAGGEEFTVTSPVDALR